MSATFTARGLFLDAGCGEGDKRRAIHDDGWMKVNGDPVLLHWALTYPTPPQPHRHAYPLWKVHHDWPSHLQVRRYRQANY